MITKKKIIFFFTDFNNIKESICYLIQLTLHLRLLLINLEK